MANKIIFSSGFQQYNNMDVEDMGIIARAKLVPQRDILFEKNASNNYENVLNCLKMMRVLNYNSAIVVSSPYNMLRTDLIFNHLLQRDFTGEITRDSLYLVPVERPIFFHPAEGGRLAQLQAIFHEYLAIVYYWWIDRI